MILKFMERKIPPLLLMLIFGTVMWWHSRNYSSFLFEGKLSFILSILAFSLGGAIVIYAVGLFKKNDTTVDPTNPSKSSALVTEGIYKFTRNPMYLGFSFILVGWGFYLGTESIMFSFGFILYLSCFQIKNEERELEKIFGRDYVEYKKRVGRWLSFKI